MQVSIVRSVNSIDGCTKERRDFEEVESSRAQSAKTDQSLACVEKNIENEKNLLNIRQCNPSTSKISSNLASSESATASVKLKSSGDVKKPYSGSSSFFNR